jgi:hypothetical protein
MRLLLMLAALAAMQERAETPEAPWIQWTVVDVRAGMVDEFLSVQRELSAHAKKAKTPWRRVARTEVFGDTYRFLIATPVEKLAAFDREPPPDAAMTALVNRAERCIEGRTSYAVRMLPDVGNPLPPDQTPDLMIVNLARVAPGREGDYASWLRTDVLPHFDEAKMHHVTGAIAFGGESGFLHLFHVRNFAELDLGSPLIRALGAEGASAVTAKLSGIVTSNEIWIARLVPDASYGPSDESERN